MHINLIEQRRKANQVDLPSDVSPGESPDVNPGDVGVRNVGVDVSPDVSPGESPDVSPGESPDDVGVRNVGVDLGDVSQGDAGVSQGVNYQSFQHLK